MSAVVFAEANWRKSTRSGGNGGQCVEVGQAPASIGLRDSKDPTGPVLAVAAPHFATFVTAVKADHFRASH
ncbi:DUF397 domain-containing protein [Fodinicola acaciae]|uniref:DUF397 domain-containing protein n=1 Tax=Fodinicola acaciae TaxID=2681555 RepID=UPI0013D89824|nr:DUF397 domain-containing protein [Fodinicola acaciae]